jgi:hypothetical protein
MIYLLFELSSFPLFLDELSLQLLIFRLQFRVRLQLSRLYLLRLMLRGLLLRFFGIRILASSLVILGALYEGYLELEDMRIT